MGVGPKDGWTTYPGVLGPMTARQYDNALREARDWLALWDSDVPTENWKVWNRLNANYEGGIETFLDDNPPFPGSENA